MAVEAEADIVVAQGCAASGRSGARTTLAVLPEVADFLHHEAHDTLLLAAGGIADSRGLAACIFTGADGVVLGTRLWASQEGQVLKSQVRPALEARGDDTTHTLASEPGWPHPVAKRALRDGCHAIPAGEEIGLLDDMSPMNDVLTSLTQKASRLMVHAQRKVIP